MSILRRVLGILVMLAGIIGILLAVAGLIGVWTVKPSVVGYATSTIDTLQGSITTSQEVMVVTEEALGATGSSLEALSVMLSSTAASVDETAPALDQVNVMMSTNLPGILEAANDSLRAAQEAAVVLDSSVRSLQTFQLAMGAVPLLSGFVSANRVLRSSASGSVAGQNRQNLDSLPRCLSISPPTWTGPTTTWGPSRPAWGQCPATWSSSPRAWESIRKWSGSRRRRWVTCPRFSPISGQPAENCGRRRNRDHRFSGLVAGDTGCRADPGMELFQGTAGRMEGDDGW